VLFCTHKIPRLCRLTSNRCFACSPRSHAMPHPGLSHWKSAASWQRKERERDDENDVDGVLDRGHLPPVQLLLQSHCHNRTLYLLLVSPFFCVWSDDCSRLGLESRIAGLLSDVRSVGILSPPRLLRAVDCRGSESTARNHDLQPPRCERNNTSVFVRETLGDFSVIAP
jgi:hypothetical protein